ncbi:hypothetical protein EVAR_87776_1 [Eumeta japonica]|uniref:Uncharacterized protein n=1 Tax=Eumeta variegata TaxID=151549 RepID=A0A4C1X760_EUMVA|nr:hypothetical protein EVAR_87776_1 [Eumeta japonica]
MVPPHPRPGARPGAATAAQGSVLTCVVLSVAASICMTRTRTAITYPSPRGVATEGSCPRRGSKRSTLDIEGKIAEWRGRASAPPASPPAPRSPTQLLLEQGAVVCQLAPPAAAAALIDDLKSRLDAKDEDRESGIHDAE